MSQHTICDKCSKPLDDGDASYIQVVVTELSVAPDGAITVVNSAVTYDYHVNHAPKFDKGEVPEPPAPEPVEPAPEEPPTEP